MPLPLPAALAVPLALLLPLPLPPPRARGAELGGGVSPAVTAVWTSLARLGRVGAVPSSPTLSSTPYDTVVSCVTSYVALSSSSNSQADRLRRRLGAIGRVLAGA